MTAHSLIHGGLVWLVTQSITLGVLETFAHFGIDCMKCENSLTPNQDKDIISQ